MTINFIRLYASMLVWMDVNWVGCYGHSCGRRRSLTAVDFDWLRSYPVASTLGVLFIFKMGWRVGSVVRALNCKSKGWGFESCPENKKTFCFSELKRLCWLAVSVPCNPRVHTHAYERPCTHVKDPVVHVRVWWVMDTFATLRMEERRRKKPTPKWS